MTGLMQREIGPDGLPVGWQTDYDDIEELFDPVNNQALSYDGNEPLPAVWENADPGFFAYHYRIGKRLEYREQSINLEIAEDRLFTKIADKIWDGIGVINVELYIRLALSTEWICMNTSEGREFFLEVMGTSLPGVKTQELDDWLRMQG